MDGDPAVEPELDSFSRTLPLPYRVALLVVLGVWGWGANLHYLSILKIDVPSLFRYPSRPSPRIDPHHFSTYRLATTLTISLALSLVLFWLLSHRSPSLVVYYNFLPTTYLLFLLIIFLLPIRRFSSSGRHRFLLTLRRVSLGGIAHVVDGKFGDILLADVLTSYAKVTADLFVSLCMVFSAPNGSATQRPDRGCGGAYLVSIIIAIPSMIRFRQCITEYTRARDAGGGGGQHLANALKYFTAFPVIVFSALQRHADPSDALLQRTTYNLWMLSLLVNSLYSFWWDVTKDWDLQFFPILFSSIFPSSPSSSPSPFPSPSPFLSPASSSPQSILRPRHLFAPNVYYLAIAIDLCLRFTWSLKLSPHLHHFADFESGIFLLELLEVVRRWGWVFLRVETEWIRSLNGGATGGTGFLGGAEEVIGLNVLSDREGEGGFGEYKDDSD